MFVEDAMRSVTLHMHRGRAEHVQIQMRTWGRRSRLTVRPQVDSSAITRM